MSLRERVLKRIATIQATNDQGVYAKHYVEDVTALLAELDRAEGLPKPQTPCPECGHLNDNIYCVVCTSTPR